MNIFLKPAMSRYSRPLCRRRSMNLSAITPLTSTGGITGSISIFQHYVNGPIRSLKVAQSRIPRGGKLKPRLRSRASQRVDQTSFKFSVFSQNGLSPKTENWFYQEKELMKTEIKWGVIFVIVSFLWITLERMVGLHDRYISMRDYLGIIFVIPAVLIMVLALAEKRRVLGGSLSFKQGFLCGMGVSIVVAILTPLYQWILFRYVSPDFVQNMINYRISQGQNPEALQVLFSFKSMLIIGIGTALVIGAITSLILAAVMRTRTARA